MNDILERLTAVIESRKLSNGGDPEKSSEPFFYQREV